MAQHRRFPATQRRQQILAVATKLFAARGFQGTTTREIAERAGVNEALIFRHFPHKEDLYWAVIDFKCRAGRGRKQLVRELRSRRDEKDKLAAIARGILRRNTADATLARLLLFTALENHRLSHRFFRLYVSKYYDILADYIRRRSRRGLYRRVPPLLAARAFVGMVFYHFLTQELFGGRRYRKFENDAVAQTVADLWLQGARADKSPPRRRVARAAKSHKGKGARR
jgi:AcrR family transcriptional regulator